MSECTREWDVWGQVGRGLGEGFKEVRTATSVATVGGKALYSASLNNPQQVGAAHCFPRRRRHHRQCRPASGLSRYTQAPSEQLESIMKKS